MEKKDKYVCTRLKSERHRLKKTIKEVAELCSVATKTVSRWEDDTPIPSDKLALLTEIDFDLLFVLKGERYRSDSESADHHQIKRDLIIKSTVYGESDRIMKNGSLDPIHGRRIGSHDDSIIGNKTYNKRDPKSKEGHSIPAFGDKARYGISDYSAGSGKSMDAFVHIPKYQVSASAGPGSYINDEETVDSLIFKKEWIHNELHNTPANLYLIHIEGESMEPSLRPGDVALVDHSDNNARRDGIYVLRMGEALLVKRLQRLPGDIIKASSDNAAYEPFNIDLKKDGHEIAIIGRVVWTGRRQ